MLDAAVIIIVMAIAALAVATTAWLVMHPRVHDGITIKVGLIVIAVGCYALAWHIADLDAARAALVAPVVRATACIGAGMVVVAGGIAWRLWRLPDVRAAVLSASGWTALDAEHHQTPIDP